jgi:putative membrane protein
MRDNIRDDPLRKRPKIGPSRSFSYWFACVGATLKRALAVLLVALLVVFAVQNADVVQVRFVVWQGDVSQALVILLALLSGTVIGAVSMRRRSLRPSH